MQEALSNVKRHAEAENISIELTIAGGNINLDIADDGIKISQDYRFE